MSGCTSGTAKQIFEVEPREVLTYCYMYGLALNLVASDALKQCKVMRDALDTIQEIIKLIKYLPGREEIFQTLKENSPAETSPGIRVLCPTR